MKTKLAFPAVGVLLVLLTASCEKIDSRVTREGITELQSIPLKFGELRSVTMTERYPGWAQLWFQDEAGTICMVRVNWVKHQMMKEHLTIARTQAATERTKP